MNHISPIGIFGGTFDPIHFGHLRLAEEMLELGNLQQIRFIPTGTPPHRGNPQVTAAQRSAMVGLAIADQAAFVLDEREVRRASLCYTVDTLRELRGELGDAQPICLLMGGDAFLQLHTWRHWMQLFDLAHIVIGCRPGFAIDERIHAAPIALQMQYAQRRCGADALSRHAAGRIATLAIPKLEISATDIRARVAEQRTIRYLLPNAVADYIYQHHLYQSC